MSKTSVAAILAAAGIGFMGMVTPDSVAFATAIQRQSTEALVEFAILYPDSPYSSDAIQLASARGGGDNGGNNGHGNDGGHGNGGGKGGDHGNGSDHGNGGGEGDGHGHNGGNGHHGHDGHDGYGGGRG